MNNIAIKSSSVLINGCIYCSDDVTAHDVVSDNMVFDSIIDRDINLEGDLIIEGKLHLILPHSISSYGRGNKVFGAIATAVLNNDLNANYNKNDFIFINSKNVYIFVDNFQVGMDIIAFSTIDKYYYRKIKLKEIYNKIQTNRVLTNTIKK